MRVSLHWLRQLVAFEEAAGDLAERLSMAGFEVEGVEDLSGLAAGVVVGSVLACQRHPDADRLSVCRVDTGAGDPLQIVCGAANVRAGIHVPVAPVGARLPAVDLTIRASALRGVDSHGMICSLRELGLADASDGIAVLEELVASVPPPGSPVGPLLGLDDTVLELAITANRPDGLSMAGIAREVAALCTAPLTLPAPPELPAAEPLPVSGEDGAWMDRGGIYTLSEFTDVRIGPSPEWLQQALQRAGLRPINNVVDITNYVMLEQGQPLHAFDRERLAVLSGGRPDPAAMGLRPARPGEAFAALDGQTVDLDDQSLVVTCGGAPVALAGVIGGAGSAVREDTAAIWLEAAVFPAALVRQSSRQAGIRSESSSRFEKGLPPEVTEAAAARAADLLRDVCGARLGRRWVRRRPLPPAAPVLLRRHALHQLLGPVLEDGVGRDLDDATVAATLTALGCHLEARPEGWAVSVPPSRRTDLQREVDLIEEVARLVGFDRFASHLPDPLVPGGLDAVQEAERRLRRALVLSGLQETTSSSLVAGDHGARVAIANPLLAEASHLRDSLLEPLLGAACRNLQASQPGFWAFEIGHVFPPPANGAPPSDPSGRQQARLSGILCGERRSELWSSSGKPVPPGYHAARGVLGRALEALNLPVSDRPLRDRPLLHPGRSAELVLEGRALGWFGQLHPRLADARDLPDATYLFDLDLERLLAAATRASRWRPQFRPYATVPSTERDLAVVVSREVPAADLLQAIQRAGRPLLEQAVLVDRFESDQLGAGRCSQAFRLRYRDPERTLTDEDVAPVHERIVQALGQRFRAVPRT